jgi:hypothetical protein
MAHRVLPFCFSGGEKNAPALKAAQAPPSALQRHASMFASIAAHVLTLHTT